MDLLVRGRKISSRHLTLLVVQTPWEIQRCNPRARVHAFDQRKFPHVMFQPEGTPDFVSSILLNV